MKGHISVILSNVGGCCDRYCSTGYSRSFSIEEMFNRVQGIEGVKGVELIGGTHISDITLKEVKKHLKCTGLKAVSIIPDHFSEAKWKKGAFSSKDSGIRKEAVEVVKNMIDLAKKIDCPLISLWPGQDGYDYYFSADYIKERTYFEQCVAECCEYDADIKIAIEYKVKEPRNRSYPSNVYSTLMMLQEIKADNCGVTIDYGHATMGYENVAESVAVLKKYGNKLFHVHMNDNYSLWDDDMIVGSVNTIAYLEFFYWLKNTGYNGWISTDQYPYREESKEAVTQSVRWIETFIDEILKWDDTEIEELINKDNACEATAFIRKILFNR